MISKTVKNVTQSVLRHFNKRLTNLNAPAKPYRYGVEFLKKMLPEVSWVIDVGVADGTADLTYSYPFGTYKYLLVEASPTFSQYLDSVQKKFPNVVVEKCFCGEQNTTTTFNINKTGHTSSKYTSRGKLETITVPVKTLDSLVSEHTISGPILLKIDVERAEIDVLRGATRTLNQCEAVIMEACVRVEPEDSGRDFATLIAFMKEHSFVVFDILGGAIEKNGVLAHVDLVFVKENSPLRVRA